MTDYIKGPDRGMAEHIRQAGGILLEQQPSWLAPTGAYICVIRGSGGYEAAAVVDTEADLSMITADMRMKNWLHVSPGVLEKLKDGPATV